MSSANGIHHILKSRDERTGAKKAYCGIAIHMFMAPITFEHAKACIKNGTRVTPCKKCFKAAMKFEKVPK